MDANVTSEGEREAISNAWQIHQAICDWTGQVDTKASFASAIEVAIIGAVVVLAGDGHQLSQLHGCMQLTLFWIGLSLLILSVIAVLSVVCPQIRGQENLRNERPYNFIFFGHVKHWEPDELARKLLVESPLAALSRQLVTMSKIAWRKHRMLQLSILGTVAGSGFVAVAALTEHL